MNIQNFFDKERWQKILKGVWIASQYGLSIALIAGCDYLLGLDWGFTGSILSILIPLLINTIRQLVKAS